MRNSHPFHCLSCSPELAVLIARWKAHKIMFLNAWRDEAIALTVDPKQTDHPSAVAATSKADELFNKATDLRDEIAGFRPKTPADWEAKLDVAELEWGFDSGNDGEVRAFLLCEIPIGA